MKKKSTAIKSKTDWKRLSSSQDDKIDFSDIPPIDPLLIKKMEIRMPRPKEMVSIRIDSDILEWFRNQGRKYQTRINAVLKTYVEAHLH